MERSVAHGTRACNIAAAFWLLLQLFLLFVGLLLSGSFLLCLVLGAACTPPTLFSLRL